MRIVQPDASQTSCHVLCLYDDVVNKPVPVNHKKSSLWLPPDGHVKVNKPSQGAIRRECREELGAHAHFWSADPIFIAPTHTVGPSLLFP